MNVPVLTALAGVLALVPSTALAVPAQPPPVVAHVGAGEAADTLPGATAVIPALPIHGPRPAEIVARRVREILGGRSGPTAWKDLAGALPELALTGGADLEGTFEAARVADSLSTLSAGAGLMESSSGVSSPAGLPPGEASPTGEGRGGDTIAASTLRVDPALAMGGVIVLVILLGGIVTARRRPAPSGHEMVRDGQGRLRAARSLASSGMSVREIARRTGMAQDAVRVLLGLSERKTATGPVATPPGRSQPFSAHRPNNSARRLDAQRDRMRAEIARGARRLRDGRVTYGGGR